jgi:hypothetical protein
MAGVLLSLLEFMGVILELAKIAPKLGKMFS